MYCLFSFFIGTCDIIRKFTLDRYLLKDILTSFFPIPITEFQFVKLKSSKNEFLLNLPSHILHIPLVGIIIRKKISQIEKLWKVIRYTKSNITCSNIFNKWFSNIREQIINDSFTIESLIQVGKRIPGCKQFEDKSFINLFICSV